MNMTEYMRFLIWMIHLEYSCCSLRNHTLKIKVELMLCLFRNHWGNHFKMNYLVFYEAEDEIFRILWVGIRIWVWIEKSGHGLVVLVCFPLKLSIRFLCETLRHFPTVRRPNLWCALCLWSQEEMLKTSPAPQKATAPHSPGEFQKGPVHFHVTHQLAVFSSGIRISWPSVCCQPQPPRGPRDKGADEWGPFRNDVTQRGGRPAHAHAEAVLQHLPRVQLPRGTAVP